MALNVDGDGYLLDMADWTPELMHELAAQDGVTLTEDMVMYIMSAREMFEENQAVPDS
jgi:tRNA 2-thiouridine synthesizing protein E